ncbi:MAG: tetratricopeptide repeat protein [Actinomycetes bacterium]
MPAEPGTRGDTALLDALREEVARHDPARRPVQHATACFHLGTALIAAGEPRAAVEALEQAAAGFPPAGLPVEHAKARMMLGVAFRDLGATAQADAAFAAAAALLVANDQPLEAAAARYNRGLVLREAGDDVAAADAFREALAVFAGADARAQATAAARELGTSLLATGDLDAARQALEESQELARRAGDRAALGAAANVRGVVELAAGRPDAAADAFLDACGAHPVSVRPGEHGMARANLALAHARAGQWARAHLAARQALAIDALPEPARRQAQEVLREPAAGAGAGAGGAATVPDPLTVVLGSATPGELFGLLRAELARLGTIGDHDARTGAVAEHGRALVAALRDPTGRTDRAAAWLEVVLEQPPALFEAVLEALVRATEDEPEAPAIARSVIGASVRFHAPQWMRVRDTLTSIAARAEVRTPWS